MSTLYAYYDKKDMMMLSYIDKKQSEKKNVVVLTPMHGKVKITNDQGLKPEVLVMYDHTKGGVDSIKSEYLFGNYFEK